jgi:prevent-host-death family protein
MKSGNIIEVGSFEAKNKLSALVDLAAEGKQIWITKHGKRMALLSSGLESASDEKEDLVSAFQQVRARTRSGPQSIKDLIEEGRR